MNENQEKPLTLLDGRKFSYSIYGKDDGFPVFYNHGFPSCKKEFKLWNLCVKTSHKLKWISFDRPGIGFSDPKRRRKLLDLPDDIIELADFLKIDKFAVVGASGGGPYGAACAYKIPSSRLVGLLLLSAIGPMYKVKYEGIDPYFESSFNMTRKFPLISRLFIHFKMAPTFKSFEKYYKSIQKSFPEMPDSPDKKWMIKPEIIQYIAEMQTLAFRQGSKGIFQDQLIYAKYWGFKAKDIPSEIPVTIWHGKADINAPVSMAEYYNKEISHSQAHFLDNEGHFSGGLNHFDNIVADLESFFKN
jgi:pimeloyl-ACP methyl ester carboxylesterase